MKTLGKALANKIATIILLVILIGGAVWYVKGRVGSGTTSEYSFVIKRFSKKSQLLVADADVETTANKKFDADLTKDWPDWTKWIADIIVSRKVTAEIPVKTEFKLELEGLTKNDIRIENNVLTFKNPILSTLIHRKLEKPNLKVHQVG